MTTNISTAASATLPPLPPSLFPSIFCPSNHLSPWLQQQSWTWAAVPACSHLGDKSGWSWHSHRYRHTLTVGQCSAYMWLPATLEPCHMPLPSVQLMVGLGEKNFNVFSFNSNSVLWLWKHWAARVTDFYFGPRFMAMIKTLYQYPKATILTTCTNDISPQFNSNYKNPTGLPPSPWWLSNWL